VFHVSRPRCVQHEIVHGLFRGSSRLLSQSVQERIGTEQIGQIDRLREDILILHRCADLLHRFGFRDHRSEVLQRIRWTVPSILPGLRSLNESTERCHAHPRSDVIHAPLRRNLLVDGD
jgi:hypothetical protein